MTSMPGIKANEIRPFDMLAEGEAVRLITLAVASSDQVVAIPSRCFPPVSRLDLQRRTAAEMACHTPHRSTSASNGIPARQCQS